MQADPVDDPIDEQTAVRVVDATDIAAVQWRLDELQHESQSRQAELRALAAQLPEATSRRALVRSMVSSIVHAPNHPLVAKRVVLKVARTPSDLLRRWRGD